MQKTRFYAGVFLLTCSTLMLELVQTRILSVVAWYYLAFFVISVAMFGLSAGAVWVYLRRDRFTDKTLSQDLSYFTAAFAVTTVLSLAVQMTLTPIVVRTITSIVIWIELAICLALPFFFSGVAVSLALTRSPHPIGRVYGVDLIGAATGCLGVLALLNATDGPSAMMWVAAIAATGAVSFAGSGIGSASSKKPPLFAVLGRPGWLVIVFMLLAATNGLTLHGLRPVAIKGTFEDPGRKLFEKWNSFSRIAVFHNSDADSDRPQMWGPSPKTPYEKWSVEQRQLNIDGAAETPMYRFDGNLEAMGFLKYDITNLAYYLPDRHSAAVIGVGGGRDLLSARVFGLSELTGVEINPILVDLLTTEPGHASYANLHGLQGLELVVDEARSWFARASNRRFDIIQMSLVDTWAATGAGAFTLSENGLYTVEAWNLFLERLSSTGVFTVSRWYGPGQVNETGRLVSLACAALMEVGVSEPRDHVFLAATQRIATLVVSRSKLAAHDVKALADACSDLAYEVLITPAAPVESVVLRNIVTARTREALEHDTAKFGLDLSPPTDERPFFFNQLRLHNPGEVFRIALAYTGGDIVPGVLLGNLVATATLLLLLFASTALVMATIIVPLRPAVRDVGRKLVVGGTAYFILIGIGFMAVEIGLLQRMSIFLGHPIYSLSVVLFTLVLATGVGSLLSDRVPLHSRRRFATWAVLASGYVVILPLWLPDLLLEFDGARLFVRALLCVLTLTPAGVLLGFGFPTGMKLVSGVDPTPTPWFWGINGAAGVLSASVAVLTSIAFGISATIILGGVCYLLLIPPAFLIGLPTRRVRDEKM